MRSILEKAIVHLLNEEQDKAEALFHKFMVEKARRIHESLRSGETVLAEGWDDEITSEEYMTEDDLESVEDHPEGEEDKHAPDEHDDEDMGTDEATDELGDDLDAHAEDDMADADEDMADAEEDMADADEDMAGEQDAEGDVDTRLADMEDQIEKLTAEFDKMMAEIDGHDASAEDDEHFDDMGDEHMDDMEDEMGDEHHPDDEPMDHAMDDMSDDDIGDETDHEMADRMEDDVTDDEAGEHDGMTEGRKGKIPPQFMKHMKKKKPVKEADKKDEKKPMGKKKPMKEFFFPDGMEDEIDKKKKPDDKKKPVEEDGTDMGDEEDLDDITESVMAELEKISFSLEDGKEVGAGKKITPNDKSPLVQASVDKRGGAQPVVRKGADHSGYERETAPPVKDMKARRNTVRGKADSVLSRVPDKGDKSAALNKDYAGSKNNKSAID